mmetsp:Transcript_95135/g.153423  ORF Transcript_95135/g.153423 Transcript_95135/m.153423 type:complete len:215 (-) Transcript_95135:196-840(-)
MAWQLLPCRCSATSFAFIDLFTALTPFFSGDFSCFFCVSSSSSSSMSFCTCKLSRSATFHAEHVSKVRSFLPLRLRLSAPPLSGVLVSSCALSFKGGLVSMEMWINLLNSADRRGDLATLVCSSKSFATESESRLRGQLMLGTTATTKMTLPADTRLMAKQFLSSPVAIASSRTMVIVKIARVFECSSPASLMCILKVSVMYVTLSPNMPSVIK